MDPLSSGKVRDIYAPDAAVVGPAQEATPAEGRPRHAKAGPEALLMVTSDRISAYDYVLPTQIAGKGAVLNQLAIWWMGKLRPLVENHLAGRGTKVPAEARSPGGCSGHALHGSRRGRRARGRVPQPVHDPD